MDKDEVRRTLTQLRQNRKRHSTNCGTSLRLVGKRGRFILKGLYKMQTIRAAKLQGVGVISFSSVKKYTWEKSKYEFEDIFTMWGEF